MDGRVPRASEYDDLAQWYDLWSTADPAFHPSRCFYVDYCCGQQGLVAEIGVGTGRIASGIASNGTRVHGIDVSPRMLELCKERCADLLSSRRLTLECKDVRDVDMESKASVVICPFRTIGHLLTMEAKQEAFSRIYRMLEPNGRFVFDHYVFDDSWAHAHDGISRLMIHHKCEDGKGIVIWDTYKYDFSTQRMACIITFERLSDCGEVLSRIHHPLSFSWINPEQVQEIAGKAGFEVKALYGDFQRGEFRPSSQNQVWVLARGDV